MKKGKEFNEEYYVLASDKEIKQGTYVKYINGIAGVEVLESGNYKKGKKDGVWEYYYDASASIFEKINRSNSLKVRGHYVNDRKNGIWTSFYLDTIASMTLSKKFGKRQRPDSLNIHIEQKDLRPKWVGQYLNDKRVGEWIGFDFDGNIEQRYNFTKQKLIFDSSVKDSLNYNKERSALFIGGCENLGDFLFYELNFSEAAKQLKQDSASVVIQFSIDINRKLTDIKMVRSNAPLSMEREALRVVKLFEDNWLPALQDGQPVTSDRLLSLEILKKITGVKIEYFFDYSLLDELP